MLKPPACRFWQVALQSGLMDAEGLQACWNALPAEKRTPDAIDRRLARVAVQTDRLTHWQAQQLVAGRSTGFKIDRYVLLELIGQGGMGRVYLARDSRLNRRVAIKILSPERVNNPRAIKRFHREAMVGAQLQHENLVRVYDEGESSGRCYLVMEFIEGRNIGQMITENGPLAPPLAARLARQVALGLEHAQRKGLIHRDVNPYNILVTRDGVAKLTDMGLAIDLSEQERVTRDGATVGTFDYVSPEQARHSHSVDTRSDIYSLGCTLYHMLSGRVPFPSASLPEKLFGHQAAEPEALTLLVPDIAPELAAVVSRMMRKSPDERYATPLEVAQALEPFTDDPWLGGPPGEVTPPIHTLTAAVAAVRQAAAAASERTTAGADPRLAGMDAGLHGIVAFPPSPSPDVAPVPTPVPVASVATVASEPIAKVPGLNLQVDFGPEPSLTESLSSARARPRSRNKERPKAAPAADLGENGAFLFRRRLVIAAMAAVMLMAGVVVVIAMHARKPGPNKAPTASIQAKEAPPPPPKLLVPKGKEVAVVLADGTVSVEPNLRTAVKAAIGSHGHVLLMDPKPMRLEAADAMSVGGGPLSIRAAEGVRPVLLVEIKGRKPFLATRADTPLHLEDVTIVARYTNPGPEPAPLIEAGADITLDHCAFRVEELSPKAGTLPGSRTVVLEGGGLTVTGCFFQNFDRSIDISCFAGVTSTIKQCMFVSNRSVEPSVTQGSASGGGGPAGWAVRLRSMPGGGGRTGRRLILDHCTANTRGLLEFNGFTPRAMIKVDLSECAVNSEALAAWRTASRTDGPGALPGHEVLSWLGQGNQYDIRGKAWLLLGSSGESLEPAPSGPTDLETWARMIGAERDPVREPVHFATAPASASEYSVPADFAVVDQGPSRSVGADPARVGPRARPATARAKP